MDVGWIDDLLALEETGTLIGAAAARHVTQPAFSRRVAAIEAWCGASLVDRSRRPLRLRPEARALLPELRATAASLQQLREDLRRADGQGSRIVIATQHSLAVSLMPRLHPILERAETGLSRANGLLRLRSVNRSEGLVLLVTGAADLLICQETAAHPLATGAVDVERLTIGQDRLVPVCGWRGMVERVVAALGEGPPVDLAAVTYPADAFLGRVLRDECLPQIPPSLRIHTRIETALTPAVAGFLQGRDLIGWLPESMVEPLLSSGALHRLPDRLGVAPLSISAVRIRGRDRTAIARIWDSLARYATDPPPQRA